MGTQKQDFTTGRGNEPSRMMLNTDVSLAGTKLVQLGTSLFYRTWLIHIIFPYSTQMCLVFDIEENVERNIPCCTRMNSFYPNGQNQCVDREAERRRCPMYKSTDRRRAATDAVRDMLGGE